MQWFCRAVIPGQSGVFLDGCDGLQSDGIAARGAAETMRQVPVHHGALAPYAMAGQIVRHARQWILIVNPEFRTRREPALWTIRTIDFPQSPPSGFIAHRNNSIPASRKAALRPLCCRLRICCAICRLFRADGLDSRCFGWKLTRSMPRICDKPLQSPA